MVTVSEQYKLEQENKRLKEKQKFYDHWTKYFDPITQSYCTVSLETIHRQASDYHNLKQKLEQIRDRADIWDGKESGWYGNKLKEILNSKEKE